MLPDCTIALLINPGEYSLLGNSASDGLGLGLGQMLGQRHPTALWYRNPSKCSCGRHLQLVTAAVTQRIAAPQLA